MSEELELCPECDSADLQNDETMFDDGYISVKVVCENCGNYWWEVYSHSFTELKDGKIIEIAP